MIFGTCQSCSRQGNGPLTLAIGICFRIKYWLSESSRSLLISALSSPLPRREGQNDWCPYGVFSYRKATLFTATTDFAPPPPQPSPHQPRLPRLWYEAGPKGLITGRRGMGGGQALKYWVFQHDSWDIRHPKPGIVKCELPFARPWTQHTTHFQSSHFYRDGQVWLSVCFDCSKFVDLNDTWRK